MDFIFSFASMNQLFFQEFLSLLHFFESKRHIFQQLTTLNHVPTNQFFWSLHIRLKISIFMESFVLEEFFLKSLEAFWTNSNLQFPKVFHVSQGTSFLFPPPQTMYSHTTHHSTFWHFTFHPYFDWSYVIQVNFTFSTFLASDNAGTFSVRQRPKFPLTHTSPW